MVLRRIALSAVLCKLTKGLRVFALAKSHRVDPVNNGLNMGIKKLFSGMKILKVLDFR